MLIKVCGMRDADNIRQVEILGPDMMGFICWDGSKRFVPHAPNYLPVKCLRVGVFVNPTLDYVLSRQQEMNFRILQLHGNESPEFCALLCKECNKTNRKVKLMKVFTVASGYPFPKTAAYENVCDLFLFDTKCPTMGGSGKTFDWSALRNYTGARPFLLSGGIGPECLNELRTCFHPRCIGVDLNSRFETAPAVKDVALLAHFISKLRNTNLFKTE